MSDENPKNSNDEYQYPSEEYVTETPLDERETEPKRLSFLVRFLLNNKRIISIIVLVLIVVIAIKVMNLHKVKKTNTGRPVLVEQSQPQPQAVIPADTAILNQLSVLEKDENNNEISIGQLKRQLEDVRNQLIQASVQQMQLSRAMNTLMGKMQKLVRTTKGGHQITSVKKTVPEPPLFFHLKAVVPGRAWIINNHGVSQSVSVGDSVPQYGIVKVVDADRGMVLMSSGKVITYGENDR